MDRRDAAHASLGSFRIAADARLAMVPRRGCGASVGCGCHRLLRRLSCVAHGDDVDHRNTWLASARIVETNASDSDLGWRGLRHLADKFRSQQYPMARRGLSHSGWTAGSGNVGALWRLSIFIRVGIGRGRGGLTQTLTNQSD